MTTETNTTAEQQARDMIERCGIRYVDAMQLTASDVVELANLIALHDELVDALQAFVNKEYNVPIDKAWAKAKVVLSRCQQT